jgi:hypothetical protein
MEAKQWRQTSICQCSICNGSEFTLELYCCGDDLTSEDGRSEVQSVFVAELGFHP